MLIDLYDFDKTVYPADSTFEFWIFCLQRCPWIVIYVPVQLVFFLLFAIKILKTGTFKSLFLRFVTLLPTEKMVKAFWDKNEHKIYPWFQKSMRARYTVVISASPDYLLREICQRLEVDLLVCTLCDDKTGKLLSINCKGAEKVTRLSLALKEYTVDTVYSDDKVSDAPIFELGKNKIHTNKGMQIPFKGASL